MTPVPDFEIGESDFLLNGRPHQIIAGAIHYFRVHPDQWADRIHKAKLMGLNTIETYVAWNAHAPNRGEFDTSAGLDLARFLALIAAEGMHAIVRPGPYICAEWDNGGLPGWLLRDPDLILRRAEPRYLSAVEEYLRQVYALVEPLQITHGGPVILVQIENEYGAYGDDKQYLADLVRVTREAGITVPLTTIDQPTPQMLADGSLPGLHLTASFGSRTVERFATLREFQPTGPLMCMEFWDGWFDDWGSHHHTTPAEHSAAELDAILAAGGSVNLYMFHGGTNFGLTNGANDKGTYHPITTSYDYDAPLDEAGNPTPKYFAFREVIARYASVPEEQPPAAVPAPEFEVALDGRVPLFGVLGEARPSAEPLTFDEIGHDRGLLLYRTEIAGDGPGVLSFGEVRDRAWIYLDGAPVGVLSREAHERHIALPRSRGELTILVEDQGRVDYGPRLGEQKGLIGGAFLDGVPISDWELTPIDLGDVLGHAGEGSAEQFAGPVIASGGFALDAPADLFLDTSEWGKGIAWVNGFSLGRYWRRGPQQTLYVPAPVTRAGRNELVILELEVLAEARATFVAGLSLGPLEY